MLNERLQRETAKSSWFNIKWYSFSCLHCEL